MKLEKYSFGMGDRFLHQGKAQLQAILNAREVGVLITPVWNKSNREHITIGTEPVSLREEADAAINDLCWSDSYRVDADHINLDTVDRFLDCSDFFTIDVADSIGEKASDEEVHEFVQFCEKYIGSLEIPGAGTFEVSQQTIEDVAHTFLKAVKKAGDIFRYIAEKKGPDNFIPEVSMDETDKPQSPLEMFFILAAVAQEGIPIQTVAPKFTGRFNKGVDYVGDVEQFEKEFNDDLAAIAFAISEFGLPANLKLSVHSGSDKFSIYKPIRDALKRTGAGLHVKTAGTTWLEELIGLAEAGGEGLAIAKEVYSNSLARKNELCGPYATVIDIDEAKLPGTDEVNQWTGEQYANALRHDQSNAAYNSSFRQLLHVGYKVAAELGDRYYNALKDFESDVSRNVTQNLWDRHIKQLFLD